MSSIFSIFGNLGQQITQAESSIADQATQAFEAIAGELFILIIINVLILARVWSRR